MDLRHRTRNHITEIRRDDRLFEKRGDYLVCVTSLEDGEECNRKPEYYLEIGEEIPYCPNCDKGKRPGGL